MRKLKCIIQNDETDCDPTLLGRNFWKIRISQLNQKGYYYQLWNGQDNII